MKLKIQAFEHFARQRGYSGGTELLEDMGSSARAYKLFKAGVRIGSDLVAELYNRFGEDAVFRFIDFEKEGLDDFTAKHIRLGDKLY